MSLADKLKLHLADKRAVWSATWPRAIAGATWDDDGGRHLLLAVEPPVLAARVVDAHVQGLDAGARVTLAFEGYEGACTPVAREAAQRLGIVLLDASALPLPEPATATLPAAAPAPVAVPPRAPRPAPPILAPAYDVPEGLVAGLEAALPAPEEGPVLIDVGSGVLDEELLGEVDGLVAALADEPVLPWSGPAPDAEPEPARVDPMEVLAMPWHHPAHARPDEHVDVLPGNPRPVLPFARPTQAPDWGLPWPRPVPPADALALADPSIWKARERTLAVHDDLDRRGGGSFGQVKTDPSAWLRRVQQGL